MMVAFNKLLQIYFYLSGTMQLPQPGLPALQPQQFQQCILIPVTDSAPASIKPAPPSNVRPGYASLCAKITGWTQIVLGLSAMALTGGSIALRSGFFFVGYGFWSGLVVGQSLDIIHSNLLVNPVMIQSIYGIFYLITLSHM